MKEPDPTKNSKKPPVSNRAEINPEEFEYRDQEPKIKVLDFKEFIGKQILEVALAYSINRLKEVINSGSLISSKNYKNLYYDSDYIKYLLKNPDKVPEEMKDGSNYYFMDRISYTGNTGVVWFAYWTNEELVLESTNLDSWSRRGIPRWKENDRVLLYEEI
jgi:hypothetical protein